MADRPSTPQALVQSFTDYGRRAAVLAGLCAALISLIEDCPVWVASVRGAGTTVGVALLVHGIVRLIVWSGEGDREEAMAEAAAAAERAGTQKKERP
jgi:hypothetical protein